MKLRLNLSQASRRWLDEALASRLCAIANEIGDREPTVDMVLVDDRYIQDLNRKYRGHDRPTDVISFSYLAESKDPGVETKDDIAGEVYVSLETLEKEAKEQGIDPRAMFLRIGVHGMLHVVGYDHKTDAEAHEMEGEERRLLTGHVTAEQLETLF